MLISRVFGERENSFLLGSESDYANDFKLVERARSYVDSSLAEPITISQICTKANCNIRTLERAFLKSIGVTPKRFLQYRRLAKLRQTLIRGDADEMSVTTALLECGLPHFGRASAYYKSLFGELPSQTLRRA